MPLGLLGWRDEETTILQMRIGRYEIHEEVGAGAMGIVYRATRPPSEQPLALKLLRPELSESPIYLRRFLHEVRVTQEVEHEHLVPILDAGEEVGRHFLVMPFIRGDSLDRALQSGPLDPVRAVAVTGQIAGALDALHGKGITHRDVKPSNVILDEEGSAWLTDLGLVKSVAYTVLTRTGDVLGTLDYLAPEIISGEPAGPASDIYSLGCLTYGCLVGYPPFAGRSVAETTRAHLGEDPLPPHELAPELPAALSEITLAALAKVPSERPATARAYARLLRVALNGWSG